MARPDGRTRLLLGGLAVASLLVLAGCSYQPPVVCGPCQADDLAEWRGYNVSTTSEVLTIDVRSDGSARWTARLELTGPALEEFRANATLARSLVRATFDDPATSSAAPSNPRNLAVRFDGDTLVVSFEEPALARPGTGGVMVVERFHDEGNSGYGGYVVRADRVVLRGPEGTVIANRPPNGERRRSAVVWREYVDERTYVVFAPDRSMASNLAAELTVFRTVAGWVAWPTLVGAVHAAILLVALGLVAVGRHRDGRPWRSELLAGRVPAVVILAGAVAVAVGLPQLPTSTKTHVFLGLLPVPSLSLGALGRFAHRGPRVRTGCLATLAAVPLPVSLWLVLGFGSASALALIWALVAAVVGLPLYLLGRLLASVYVTEG